MIVYGLEITVNSKGQIAEESIEENQVGQLVSALVEIDRMMNRFYYKDPQWIRLAHDRELILELINKI